MTIELVDLIIHAVVTTNTQCIDDTVIVLSERRRRVKIVMLCFCTYIMILFFFFFFNDTATTEIYTLSLHDALPISVSQINKGGKDRLAGTRRSFSVSATMSNRCLFLDMNAFYCSVEQQENSALRGRDRKSTRLNSSHSQISYAVFCLKKKTDTAIRCVKQPDSPNLRSILPIAGRL